MFKDLQEFLLIRIHSEKGDGLMKLSIWRFTKAASAILALMLLMVLALSTGPVSTSAKTDDFDAAAFYKAKCAMCHGPKAEKKFDATMPDDQMQAAILTGKKVEKPPNMPEFQSKGVTAEQATALIAYMKSLKQ